MFTQQSSPVSDPAKNTVQTPSAPKRGAPDSSPAAPERSAHRADVSSLARGDLGLPRRHGAFPPASYKITAATAQSRLAGKEPTRGRPAYSVLCLDGSPAKVLRDPVISGLWTPTMAGSRAPQWILSHPLSRQRRLCWSTPENFAPLTMARVWRNHLWVADSRTGNRQIAPRAMGNNAANGVWECARGPTPRESTIERFPIWAPPLRVFERRDPAKQWRSSDARAR